MNFRRIQTAKGLLYTGGEVDGTPFEIFKTAAGYELSIGGETAGTFSLLRDARTEADRIEREMFDAKLDEIDTKARAEGIVEGAMVEVLGQRGGPVKVLKLRRGIVTLERRDGSGEFLKGLSAIRRPNPAPAAEAPEPEELVAERPALRIRRGDVVEIAGRNGMWTVVRLTGKGTLIAENENRQIEVPGSAVLAVLSAEEDGPEGWAAKRAELARKIIDGAPGRLVEETDTDAEADELEARRARKAAEPALHSRDEIAQRRRTHIEPLIPGSLLEGWARLSEAVHGHRRGEALHAVAILSAGDRIADKGLNLWDVREVTTDGAGQTKIRTVHHADGFSRNFGYEELIALVEAGEARIFHEESETAPVPLSPRQALELVGDALEYHAREWDYTLTLRHIEAADSEDDRVPALEVRIPGAAYVLYAETLS
ncbi:hypothetical protein SEA_ALTADENA_48 [Arthrobacter phage Altadena]|uniref:Uncharacterized protein n=1 Tax=Arthrobacter phage Altadena TaxID=3059064 RepID=A0AA96HTD1_9CAUD|nr:hypothetical protein SEA_ALTADENA_48 [Arthrobacter phage Altadena]